ncbi:aspartate aminotransferase [Emericellopsis atlantica]|uniref:Aspartate aminotransferase n=1 Tax=Emericellopsis atlantica TaxID=2614577 RepID=A0A9P8CLH4_9HYPO|nr:aspartate aminotransferase [Emericellopsis atlantica]KAG9251639.1 aspartate aminotransferase [Emericellopsis atlantica]
MGFEHIQPGPPDPMYTLKYKADNDTSSEKVDLGVGIYRDEEGHYQGLESVKQAESELFKADPGHDYEMTTGNQDFLAQASQTVFGKKSIAFDKLTVPQVASVQTISGTGAVHLAALFIAQCMSSKTAVYVGVPTWGNYRPAMELVGLRQLEYPYLDEETRTFDHETTLEVIRTAEPSSVFVLQACCHNPTACDPTPAQWEEIIELLHAGKHIPLFDMAYQGLGDGIDEDAYAVRAAARKGLNMFVCQSFSKNMALYGERCGALHVACESSAVAANVHDRLRCLLRWEVSSAPIYGSRLANIVLQNDELKQTWEAELGTMRKRLGQLRRQLFILLTEKFQTPGDWTHITREKGLFSYLKISRKQCIILVDEHHIYLPENGRINVSGLNSQNVMRVAQAIDSIVRDEQSSHVAMAKTRL